MKPFDRFALLLHLLLSFLLGVFIFVKEGGCDRIPDDDDGEPACKPGDDSCKVDAPAPPSPPPVGPPA
jgi:hypothetical protein